MANRLRGRAGVVRRDRILLRDRYTCRLCGRVAQPRDLRVDHITPLALSGKDDRDVADDELRSLCVPCHDKVTREEFGLRERIEGVGVDRAGRPTSAAHPWNRRA